MRTKQGERAHIFWHAGQTYVISPSLYVDRFSYNVAVSKTLPSVEIELSIIKKLNIQESTEQVGTHNTISG